MVDRIIINFGAETREVEVAGRKIGDVLDDTEKALEELGSAGEDATEKTTDGLKKVEDAAKKTGEEVEAKGGEGFAGMAEQAIDAVDSIDTSITGLAAKAGGVAGIVSSAVGAGFDFIKGEIEAQLAAVEAVKESIRDMYATAIEDGRRALDQTQIIAAAIKIQTGDQSQLDAYAKKAQEIGVSQQTYILAQAGSYEDLQVVIEATTVALENSGKVGEDKSKSGQAAAIQERRALEAILKANEDLLAIHEAGAEAAERTQDIRDTLSQRERDQIKRTQDADAARWAALQASYEAANALPPVDIKTEVQEPDIEKVFNKLQAKANGKVIRFPAIAVTRNGHEVD